VAAASSSPSSVRSRRDLVATLMRPSG